MPFFTDLSLIFQDERGCKGLALLPLSFDEVQSCQFAMVSRSTWPICQEVNSHGNGKIYHHSWRIYWSWMESGFSQAWYFPFEFAYELWSKFLFLCLIRRLRTYETPLELVRNDPFHQTTSSCPRTGHRHGPRVILKNIMLKLFQVIEKSIYK